MRRAAIPEPRGDMTTPAGVVHTLHGATMGTTWSVKLVAAAPPPDLGGRVQAVLDGVVAQMSHWEPTSELSRFNAAPAWTWMSISADFAAVMRCALTLAEATDGAFDPALGAATAAWGFGPPVTQPPPAFAPGGWRRLQLEGERLLQPGGLWLDLSGIAKGYAVDRVARVLEARGLGSVLVEIGGELYGRGVKPDGQPWWATLESPRDGLDAGVAVALPGWAVATSGDYRRFLAVGGRRLAHTLDPRAGRPLEDAPASVSVLAPDAMSADAWATALTVMGEAQGLAFADRRGLAALFIAEQGGGLRLSASRAWRETWA